MSAVAIAATAAVGLGEAAVGFFKEKSANKRAKQLAASRPKLQASPYLQDALTEAESAYSQGMSPEAKAAYEQDADRDLSTSVGASLRMGGSPNNVASIVSASDTGRQRLAIMKDQMKLSNLNNLFRAQTAMEESRQQGVQFNEWAPWADDAQANAQAKATGQSEIFSGINTAASGAMRFGEAASVKKDYGGYFAPRATSTPATLASTTTGFSSPASTVNVTPNSSFLDGLLNEGNNG